VLTPQEEAQTIIGQVEVLKRLSRRDSRRILEAASLKKLLIRT
jgi:hypothetical protein